jgi:threonine aldolase
MNSINIRSDTQTLPTEEMLDAIRAAELGDDTYDKDPTVKRLEAMAADAMAKEAAMLVISGTMGNLVALMCHGGPGDEVFIDPASHLYQNEGGGFANVAGLTPMPVPSHKGLMNPNELAESIRKKDQHHPDPRLLCLENTHNRGGGRVVPLALHKELCAVARDHGLLIHLDGARIFNAAVAAGLPASAYTEDVDTVMFCLSKGLCCPLGSVIAGSREFIDQALHARRRIGGGMRQAGIIAAAGIVALEQMIDRLAEDHANARYLAESIRLFPGLDVDMETMDTNMVYVELAGAGLTTQEAVPLWRDHGVEVSGRPPAQIRMVVTRHHDRKVIDEVLKRIRTAMASVE